MKSISRGLTALILVSAILLFSDLPNRNKNVQKQQASGQQSSNADGITLPKGVKFKLCLVHYIDNHFSEECEKGMRQALADKNLKEGIDFTLKVYNAQGDMSTLNSIAGSVGNETWDLIFSNSTPTIQMLVKKVPDKKIVFSCVGDPLAAGLGKTFEDHVPNVTGISTMSDFDGLIKLVKFLHPYIKRVGTVFTPAEINSVSYKNCLEKSAVDAGIELIAVPANSATEVIDAANSLVSRQIDVFCQISDNLTGSCCSAILKVSLDSKVPYYGFVSQQLGQGAVAVCARDYFQAGIEAGLMGLEVLSGRDPSKMPFQNVKKTDYLINPETARLYNIIIPDNLYSTFPTMKIQQK